MRHRSLILEIDIDYVHQGRSQKILASVSCLPHGTSVAREMRAKWEAESSLTWHGIT